MKTHAMTYADYAAMPEDGRRYELFEGELVEMSAPDDRHQAVLGMLHMLLLSGTRRLGLGRVRVSPYDVVLSDSTVFQPDIVVVMPSSPGRIEAHGLVGAPTLAVEVLSRSTSRRDLGVKKTLYARHGTPWYWIVDPNARRIEVHRLVGGAFVLERKVEGFIMIALPPLETVPIDLREVWEAD